MLWMLENPRSWRRAALIAVVDRPSGYLCFDKVKLMLENSTRPAIFIPSVESLAKPHFLGCIDKSDDTGDEVDQVGVE